MVTNISSYQAIYDLCPNTCTGESWFKNDQLDASRGTTSTVNVARRTFSKESGFIECMLSLFAVDIKEPHSRLHTNLAAILRIFNSDRRMNLVEIGIRCKNIYIMILEAFPGQVLA